MRMIDHVRHEPDSFNKLLLLTLSFYDDGVRVGTWRECGSWKLGQKMNINKCCRSILTWKPEIVVCVKEGFCPSLYYSFYVSYYPIFYQWTWHPNIQQQRQQFFLSGTQILSVGENVHLNKVGVDIFQLYFEWDLIKVNQLLLIQRSIVGFKRSKIIFLVSIESWL